MNNFIYFTFQTNLIVIKLLHYSARMPQGEFIFFVIVIEFGVIASLIYLH